LAYGLYIMINTHFAQNCGIIGGILTLYGFYVYGKDSFSGDAKPAKAGWIIWAIVTFLTMISYISSTTAAHPLEMVYRTVELGMQNPAIFFAVANFIGCAVVAAIAFWKGKKGWTFTDKLCLLCAGVSVAIWYLSGSALIGLCITLVADFIGAIPTIKHALEEPHDESKHAWLVFSIGTAVSLFGVSKLEFEELVFPIYFVFIDSIIASLVLVESQNFWLRRKVCGFMESLAMLGRLFAAT